jgi:hypothetical protein
MFEGSILQASEKERQAATSASISVGHVDLAYACQRALRTGDLIHDLIS